MSNTVVPDLIEPLIGYRFFYLDKVGLCGAMGRNWETPQLQALCSVANPVSPCNDLIHHSYGLGCGIYSYKTYSYALGNKVAYEDSFYHTSSLVLAKCLVWGTVYEHEQGYRSSNARVISAICFTDSNASMVKSIWPAVEVLVTS